MEGEARKLEPTSDCDYHSCCHKRRQAASLTLGPCSSPSRPQRRPASGSKRSCTARNLERTHLPHSERWTGVALPDGRSHTRKSPAIYPERVHDLSKLDLEEIATALSDQTDYEHRWLIDPTTGQVAFWTSDTGIDGQNPVDLDDLDLIPIDPLPASVWYEDRLTSPRASVSRAPGAGSVVPSEAGRPSGGSRTSCTRSTPNSCPPGTPSAMRAASGERSSGSLNTNS